jgi:hypothetical protein
VVVTVRLADLHRALDTAVQHAAAGRLNPMIAGAVMALS